MVLNIARDGGVTSITITRGDCGNLISTAMGAEIIAALAAAVDGCLVVLRGEGSDFCLGRDMGGGPLRGSAKTALDIRSGNTEPALALMGAIRRSPVPVLGIVQGRAIGLGCGLSAICDITIASDDATFRLPEMGHGIPPCLAMSALIDRVPYKAITRLVYSMQPIDAAEALNFGIVSQVVARDALESTAASLIETIAQQPAPAVRAVKEFMRSAPRMDPQGAADFGSNLLAGVLSSSAH
jgi:enoyl-CoA hydratase